MSAPLIWIDHNGKDMPVHGLTPVIPQFRADGCREVAEEAAGGKGVSAHAYEPFWTHDGGPCDIVAYCEVLA